MKTGLIVYNTTQYEDKYMEQINAYMNAFDRVHIQLIKASNAEVISTLGEHKNIKFVLFYDKDIALAYELERRGYRVFNRASVIATCDDKAYTYIQLEKNRIPTPKTTLLPYMMGKNMSEFMNEIQPIIDKFPYPFVLKERIGSFGDQVYLINDENELAAVLHLHGDKPMIIQEFIEESRGRDIRAFVVGNKVEIAVTRTNENDFRSNVNQGGVMALYKKKKKISKIAINASKAIGADFAGVDIVFNKKKRPLVLEVNSNPRTESIKEATNFDVCLKVAKYIKSHYKSK